MADVNGYIVYSGDVVSFSSTMLEGYIAYDGGVVVLSQTLLDGVIQVEDPVLLIKWGGCSQPCEETTRDEPKLKRSIP